MINIIPNNPKSRQLPNFPTTPITYHLIKITYEIQQKTSKITYEIQQLFIIITYEIDYLCILE